MTSPAQGQTTWSSGSLCHLAGSLRGQEWVKEREGRRDKIKNKSYLQTDTTDSSASSPMFLNDSLSRSLTNEKL